MLLGMLLGMSLGMLLGMLLGIRLGSHCGCHWGSDWRHAGDAARETNNPGKPRWLAGEFSLQPVLVLILRAAKYTFVTLQPSRNHTDARLFPQRAGPTQPVLGRCDAMGTPVCPSLTPRAPAGRRRDARGRGKRAAGCWLLAGV